MDKKNKNTIPPKTEIKVKNIPLELKMSPYWGLWKWRFVRGQWTKVPVAPNGSSIDARSYSLSLKKAYKYFKKSNVSGIGFYFSPDHDFFGIDFDDCVSEGRIRKDVKKIIKKLDSYYEISVSGSGIHILGVGGKSINGVDQKFVYQGSRYFTFTGQGKGELKNISKKTNKIFHKEKLINQATTGEKESNISIADLYRIVMNIRPDLSEPDWFLVCKAIHYKTEGSEKGWKLFNSWSSGKYCKEDQKYSDYTKSDCVAKWNRCKLKGKKVGIPTLRRIESLYPVSVIVARKEIFKKNRLETIKYNSNELKEKYIPKKLRLAVREVARFNKVPIDPVITTILMVFSAAINKKVIIEERGGREHNCSMGCIIGMSTGARKSAIDEDLMRPYFEHEKELIKMWDQEKFKNQVAIKLLKKKLKEVENADELKEEDKLELMTEVEKQIAKKNCGRPKLIESDVTEERLSDTLSKNNETIFIQSDDARNTITNITGRYDSTSENIYISGITGSPYRRSRIKDDVEIVLFKPCINMCLKVQLDKLQSLVTKNLFKESGLIARLFLKVVEVDLGEQIRENKDDVDLDLSEMKHYYYAIKRILSYQGKPILVCLSKEAKEERLKFTHEYADLLKSDWNDNYDVSNKIVTLSVKMATVLTIMNNPSILEEKSKEFENCHIEISLNAYKVAKKIVKILMSQTLEVLGKMEKNSLIEGTQICLNKIKEYLKKSGNKEFTMTDIKSKYDNNKRPMVDQYLNILEEEKLIVKDGKSYELN